MMNTVESELEIYFAILPGGLDDDSARELASDRARTMGLVPTGDVELRTALSGGREVRMADVVCRKPKGWSRNPEITFAPLYKGLVKVRKQVHRKTGRRAHIGGKGPQG